MRYRVVYSILEDHHTDEVGLAVVLVLLPIVVMVVVGRGVRREGRPDWWKYLIVPSFLLLVFSGFIIHFAFKHVRATGWARGGQYEVAEGTFSGFRRYAKAVRSFEVGGTTFYVSGGSFVGFRGQATGPASVEELRPGVPVRVAHHDGIVLRVEVGEPPR